MSEQTNGRLAMVTGGPRGIGSAICRRLLKDGYRVATNCRNEEMGRKWQAALREEGHEVHLYVFDVGDNKQCEEQLEAIQSEHGTIDILVNNAGITRDSSLRKMTFEQWEEVIRVDLNSLFNMTKPILPAMVEQGFGRIVNISSINGQKGQIGQTNYSAAKAGVHGFTKALAQEVARKGITVNTLSPGYIGTDMVMAMKEGIRDLIISQIPVGRLGLPDEVAAGVAYLVSDHSGFVTGSNLSINGGQHMY
ncbi:MAG: acetoacetyl-CoA reductase [Gammaproteobacteria bacterium]|nr:acetoacetyl-CoA reductase [Gammaproteobacteria bacterium]